MPFASLTCRTPAAEPNMGTEKRIRPFSKPGVPGIPWPEASSLQPLPLSSRGCPLSAHVCAFT